MAYLLLLSSIEPEIAPAGAGIDWHGVAAQKRIYWPIVAQTTWDCRLLRQASQPFDAAPSHPLQTSGGNGAACGCQCNR